MASDALPLSAPFRSMADILASTAALGYLSVADGSLSRAHQIAEREGSEISEFHWDDAVAFCTRRGKVILPLLIAVLIGGAA